jgi:hypothetical protein
VIKCMNHPVRDADFHCSACQVAFCKDCVNVRPYERGKIEVCPQCQNAATNLTPFKPVEPFWTQVPYFVAWPFRGDAWMYLVGWAVASVVLQGLGKMGLAFGGIGWVGGIIMYAIYYGMLISYFYRIVGKAEEGKFKVPDFTEFQGIGGSILLGINFLIAMFAVFWPVIAVAIPSLVFIGAVTSFLRASGLILIIPLGILLFLLFLTGLALMPMSLLVMGVFRNLLFVLNPIFLITQIRKIASEYFIGLAMVVGLLILRGIITIVLALLLHAVNHPITFILVFPVDGMVELYFWMVLGHLLGYMAYQTRYKLQWWPETVAEPVFMVKGRPFSLTGKAAAGAGAAAMAGAARVPAPARGPAAGAAAAPGPAPARGPAAAVAAPRRGPAPSTPAPAPGPSISSPEMEDLARQINDGMSMLDHGRYDDASALFRGILEQAPNHLGALRGAVMASLRLNDLDSAREFSRRQGSALAGQKAYDAMWEMLTELRKQIKDFNFTAKDQFMLARWLVEQDLPLEAAKTLRELGVAYPEDQLAAKALYQCGDLLWKKCGKPEAAAQMFNYILKRYPGAAFTDQIYAALTQLKAGK